MLYLTFNDAPSGIFYSQVTDTCRFLASSFSEEVKLISFISLRNFSAQRKKIRNAFSNSLVLPMFPGVEQWRNNYFLLNFFAGRAASELVMARGPFAAALALRLKRAGKVKNVCFDARGAYAAEFTEYDVSGSAKLRAQIAAIEKEAVNGSDLRLAVSNKLVDHWRKVYGYRGDQHVVIPCTLNNIFEKGFDPQLARSKRQALGVEEKEILIVYSGSAAGWQSADLAACFMERLMESDPKIKLLLLTKAEDQWLNRLQRFRQRIIQRWVEPFEVRAFLHAADFGLLVRERSVTNEVASPVKFAEYLSCGLKIIISEGIGDFSAFVKDHKAGQCIASNDPIPLGRPSEKDKQALADLSLKMFTKSANSSSYLCILNQAGTRSPI